MKKIDKLLLTSFIGPFFVTFFIAIFVLMMQYLWVYVDDIIGKGVGLFVIIELIAYLTVSLIPMALPIAVLISSVMIFGDLAERYELSSLKSAGISLLRIMRPLMVVGVFISIFSFFSSNDLMPVSNLKFKSRLYDIRKQQPTLSLEEGIFNDDFKGMVIRIGEKGDDDETIKDVMIYDHSNTTENRMTQILAKDGRMYTSKDGRYFVMDLKDGNQYSELKPDFKKGRKNYPFVRISFEQWTKVFDLGVFDLQETDEELFKSHHSMLNVSQLATAVDSIDANMERKRNDYKEYVNGFYQILKNKSPDTTKVVKSKPKKKQQTRRTATFSKPYQQVDSIDIDSVYGFHELFVLNRQRVLLDKAKTVARSIQTQAESNQRTSERIREKRVKHVFEMHSKFSLAVACFIFLFIGAPMGAIVRKGGFGYPILVSIIFFMIYVILTIMCKKLSESYTLPADLAAWTPCLVLFPIGVWLSIKAMKDSTLLNIDALTIAISKIFKKKNATTED